MTSFRDLVAEGRRLEQAGDLTGAIAQYSKVIALQQGTVAGVDPSLYNRVGDLYQRTGDLSRAVAAYEAAVDLYERQELYPNAVALCKKILRNAPEQLHVCHRSGRLLARSGLPVEARQQFAEYATALEREGRVEESIEALEELQELIPDDETRDFLVDAYLQSGHREKAVDQLLDLWRERAEGSADASSVRDRIIAIDPGSDPLGVETARSVKAPVGASQQSAANTVEEVDDELSEEEALVSELRDVLRRLEGEGKLRQAIPIVDQLLELQPDKLDLLLRKLRYALSLRDDQTAIEAYLALGLALERNLDSFSIRFLSSSSSDGVTAAVAVRAARGQGAAE
jgi:tetratricopeptide (TPR) repeat protein